MRIHRRRVSKIEHASRSISSGSKATGGCKQKYTLAVRRRRGLEILQELVTRRENMQAEVYSGSKAAKKFGYFQRKREHASRCISSGSKATGRVHAEVGLYSGS